MRFAPFPRFERPAVTKQRIAAAARAIQRERERAGLFVDELGPRETPEERVARLDQEAAAYWQRLRDGHARAWREARRQLYDLPEEQKRAILDVWQRGVYPATPEYLLDLIRRHTEGRESRPVSPEGLGALAFASEGGAHPQAVQGQMTLF